MTDITKCRCEYGGEMDLNSLIDPVQPGSGRISFENLGRPSFVFEGLTGRSIPRLTIDPQGA